MKKLILVAFVFAAVAVQAQKKQSLKDLLYSGKLKKDSSGVIRSTDDLSTKIDTTTKKEPEVVKTQPAANVEPVKKTALPTGDAGVAPAGVVANDTTASVAAPASTVPVKSNTKLLKEYTDSLVKTLKADVLKSKQVKKDTYFLMLDYEIATDGQVTFTNVSSTPENSFLQAQVQQIIDSTPLRLTPVTDSANQPKKVKKKQQISVTKE